jgi:hypothetical protein
MNTTGGGDGTICKRCLPIFSSEVFESDERLTNTGDREGEIGIGDFDGDNDIEEEEGKDE